MDGTPTDHVLRPHHITLLIIISAAFKDLAIRRLPNPFALHIHRVLLNEVSEVRCSSSLAKPLTLWKKVSLPKPHMELLSEISAGPSVHSPESQAFIEEITSSVREHVPYLCQFFDGVYSHLPWIPQTKWVISSLVCLV